MCFVNCPPSLTKCFNRPVDQCVFILVALLKWCDGNLYYYLYFSFSTILYHLCISLFIWHLKSFSIYLHPFFCQSPVKLFELNLICLKGAASKFDRLTGRLVELFWIWSIIIEEFIFCVIYFSCNCITITLLFKNQRHKLWLGSFRVCFHPQRVMIIKQGPYSLITNRSNNSTMGHNNSTWNMSAPSYTSKALYLSLLSQ